MITCPICRSFGPVVKPTFCCVLDPANDKFRCLECGHEWKRYGKSQPKPETKMRFKMSFDIKGPAGLVKDVPNAGGVVECVNLAGLLVELANNLPHNPYLGVETVGIRVECIEETK